MKRNRGLLLAGVTLFLIVVGSFGLPYLFRTTYSEPVTNVVTTAAAPVLQVAHVTTPNPVHAVYMTSCVASTPSWREKIADMVSAPNSNLNAVVIDIKDYSGTISFSDPALQPYAGNGCQSKDLKTFIAELHSRNTYVIGRITVFQDPLESVTHPDWAIKSKSTGGLWKDPKGLAYIDVGATPYWDWVIQLAKDSYNQGFDEINFDYIRYPSDGNLDDMNTTWTVGSSTKAEMVKSFFEYLHGKLADVGMKTSADLFGLVTVSNTDLGIGQVLLNALPYFDYVDPMVYPSHFSNGTDGYGNPAEYPYQIITYSMGSAVKREQALDLALGLATSTPTKLRPWLQDFDLGAVYTSAMVHQEIQASHDVGLDSWLIWNPSNSYDPAKFQNQTLTRSK